MKQTKKTDYHPGIEEKAKLAGRYVVGACLVTNSLIETARLLIEPDMIPVSVDREIYKVILDLEASSNPADIYSVFVGLNGDVISNMGGASYLMTLMNETPFYTESRIRHASKILSEYHQHLEMRRLGELIVKNPSDDELQLRMAEMTGVIKTTNGMPVIASQLDSYMNEKDAIAAGRIKPIFTGLSRLDRVGISKGKIVTVGARPGVGKSALMIQLASHFIGNGLKVLFVSAEMGFNEVMDRIVALRCRINASELRTTAVKQHIDRISDVCQNIHGSKFHLDDRGRIDMTKLRGDIRRIRPDIVFLDFIQLIAKTPNEESRALQVASIANEFKALSMENQFVGFMGSQLRRDHSKTNRRPTMDDLKESGGIEEASDVVILLHPENVDHEKDYIDIICLIEKNRTGERGEFSLRFIKRFVRFDEVGYD